MEEKIIHCPICNTPTSARAFLQTYISPYNNQEYKMYECSNCEVQWWEPLKMIPEFYEKEIFEEYKFLHMGTREEEQKYKIFFKYFPKNVRGKLFDIGCGDGLFLKEAKKFGFDVYGIDFDRRSIKTAQQKFNLKNVFALSLEDFYEISKKQNLNFNVITFFNVLEHQDNPKRFIELVKLLLNTEGWIAGYVPNIESWLHRKIYIETLNIDYPPHHFLWFSKRALEKFLSNEGFDIEVYIGEHSMKEFIILFQKALLGKRGQKIEFSLKKNFLKNTKNEKFFRIIKNLRNFFFSPSILLKPFFQGTYLYFQGKLRRK